MAKRCVETEHRVVAGRVSELHVGGTSGDGEEGPAAAYLLSERAQDRHPGVDWYLNQRDALIMSAAAEDATAGGAGVLHPVGALVAGDNVALAVDLDGGDRGRPKYPASASGHGQQPLWARTDTPPE